MILDEIIFDNFGVYRGHQGLALTPPSPDKPIILLGGLNGGGKTTLLDGLQLALYGKNAHCSNRGELGYDEFLRLSMHHGVDPQEGSAVEVAFRHTEEGQEHSYRIRRSWAENGKGMKEQVEVRLDGAKDEILSEQWSEQVETFVPHGISDLFFFDGEKIEQLADISRAARVLSTAIHSLLGIELVDRLGGDLIILERRKRFVTRSDSIRKQVEEFDTDIRRFEQMLESITLERGSAQNELDLAEKLLRQARERFRLEGGELFAQREQISAQKAIIESRCLETDKALRELAVGGVPFLIVRNLLADLERQARIEQQLQESKMLFRLLEERDQALLKLLRSAGGGSKVIGAAQRFCEDDRRQRSVANQTPCYLGSDAMLGEEIRSILNVMLPDAQKKAVQLVKEAEVLNEQLVKLERELTAVPDAESLENLRQELAEAETVASRAKARVDTLDARISQLERERDQKRAEREALLMADIDEQVKHLDDVRILQHSERVRNTLQKFRVAVVQRHVSRIENLMLDSFRQLLRKKALVSEIKINPDNFVLELRGGNGKSLSPDRLSAGERQLLAVSMLWGLARASGRPLPTIIDTPLGRLDSQHRTHLVDRYFPYASHQVVLLSTDEEIDEHFFAKLKPRIGRTYNLSYSDDTRSTEIKPGYFWEL